MGNEVRSEALPDPDCTLGFFRPWRHLPPIHPRLIDFLACQPFQITGETVGEVRAVAGMHQRKAEMARNSDAFIALPGKQPLLPATACSSVAY